MIYYIYGCEIYLNLFDGNYYLRDKKNLVMEVGSVLISVLDSKGWGVVYIIKYYDYLFYNNFYVSSLKII